MTGTAVDILTCPDCLHPWVTHYPASADGGGGGCGMHGCRCTEPRRVISAAERTAAIRAQVGDEPLVSNVGDRRTVLIGHYVREADSTGLDHERGRHGIVVERWATEDHEPGVVAIRFASYGADLRLVGPYWLLVANLTDEWLPPRPDPATCALYERKLFGLLHQGIDKRDWAQLVEGFEQQCLNWALALHHASQPERAAA